MINKQLLDFIKQQLDRGIDKEAISKELGANGWSIQDIEEAYKSINALAPNQPISTSYVSQGVTKQVVMNGTIEIKHSFRNPSWSKALFFILSASILSSLLFLINPQIKVLVYSRILSLGILKFIGLEISALFVLLFISSIILNLITHILKITESSVPKALLFSAIMQIVTACFIGISPMIKQTTMMPLIVLMAMIVIYFIFFCWHYKTSFNKTIAVFLLNIVFCIILGIIFIIISFFLGFNIFSFLISLSKNSALNNFLASWTKI